MIVTMGETVEKEKAGKAAGQFFANEGKGLFSELTGALGDRLSNEIRGDRGYQEPQPQSNIYLNQATQNPMVIGAMVLGGVAVLALVLK